MELSSRSQKKVDSILRYAEMLFVKYGFNKVTMDSIAHDANVSKVTLYKYFSDKATLYETILKNNYLIEFNRIEEVIKSEMDFKTKVEEVIKSRLNKYYDKDLLLMEKNYHMTKDLIHFIQEHTQKMKLLNEILYAQGKEEGLVRKDLSNTTINFYFRVIRSGLVDNFDSIKELSNEELTIFLDFLYAGILGCNNK